MTIPPKENRKMKNKLRSILISILLVCLMALFVLLASVASINEKSKNFVIGLFVVLLAIIGFLTIEALIIITVKKLIIKTNKKAFEHTQENEKTKSIKRKILLICLVLIPFVGINYAVIIIGGQIKIGKEGSQFLKFLISLLAIIGLLPIQALIINAIKKPIIRDITIGLIICVNILLAWNYLIF